MYQNNANHIAYDNGSEIVKDEIIGITAAIAEHESVYWMVSGDVVLHKDLLGQADDEIGNAVRFASKRIAQIDKLYSEINGALDSICCEAMKNKDIPKIRALIHALPARSFHRSELLTFYYQSGYKKL